MQNKNIVFCLRRDFIQKPGGDTTQMESWAKVLRRLGAQVHIHAGAVQPEDLRNADFVFIWHLERLHESFQPWNVARKLNIPVVLVPTYWRRQKAGIGRAFTEQIKLWARCVRHGRDEALLSMFFRSWQISRRTLLQDSAILAVNSNAEKELLLRDGARKEQIRVIPNVINPEEISAIAQQPWETREGIVCIGHFCPRKNQLGIIRALANTGLRITFIGAARPMHQHYFDRCRDESFGRHRFTGPLPHHEVLEFLSRSRLSICASFAETPGICNLEAAGMGCNLVLPDIAPVREYFNGRGYYIQPETIDPSVILKAFNEKPAPELRLSVMEQYTESVLERIFSTLNEEAM